MSASLGEREMLWEQEPQAKCWHKCARVGKLLSSETLLSKYVTRQERSCQSFSASHIGPRADVLPVSPPGLFPPWSIECPRKLSDDSARSAEVAHQRQLSPTVSFR